LGNELPGTSEWALVRRSGCSPSVGLA